MNNIFLTRRIHFSAAHRLHSLELSDEENRRIFEKCNNPSGHGHNYVLEVTLRGTVDPKTGMVMNLSEITKILEETVIKTMDHKHLNLDIPFFKKSNPTAENIAVFIWSLLAGKFPQGLLYEVKLQETENNSVVYRGE